MDYMSFLKATAEFFKQTTCSQQPIFKTNVADLFELFLQSLPNDRRQEFNCRCCRHFFERYGDLVEVDSDGVLASVMWKPGNAPVYMRPAIRAIKKAVEDATISCVFLSEDFKLGTDYNKCQKGEFHHFAVHNANRFKGLGVQTAHQASCEKNEDFKNMKVFFHDFPLKALKTAHDLLQSESLYRSEKVAGHAKWLYELSELMGQTSAAENYRFRDNVLWHAVAKAPTGFLHPRATMIGPLLEDIASGLSFGDVAAKFRAKMDPTKYQRPTAAPASQTVKQAQDIVDKLGLNEAFERRYLRYDEVPAWVWQPQDSVTSTVASSSRRVFDSLYDVNKPNINIASTTNISWRQFLTTVLPEANRIQVQLLTKGNAMAPLVTAVHEHAPPILQWDNEDERNPVSHYMYVAGAKASDYGLSEGWHLVTGIAYKPHMWHDGIGLPNQSKGVLFVIKDAREMNNVQLCLFPEIVRNELHSVRSVIEHHNSTKHIQGKDFPHVAGHLWTNGSMSQRILVNGVNNYTINSWD